MSRWSIQSNSNNILNNPTIFYPTTNNLSQLNLNERISDSVMSSTFQVSGGTPSGDNEVRQHGSIGRFSNSVNDGPDSSFIKCIYFDKYNSNLTVPVLCQKPLGCCTEGCCPRDTLSTQCLFILLGFVLLVFLGGCCIWIISYQKSKLEQRKNEREYYREREYEDNMSQAGGYHHHQAMPYSVYGTGVPG